MKKILTPSQELNIMKEYCLYIPTTYKSLSKKYNCSQTTIRNSIIKMRIRMLAEYIRMKHSDMDHNDIMIFAINKYHLSPDEYFKIIHFNNNVVKL